MAVDVMSVMTKGTGIGGAAGKWWALGGLALGAILALSLIHI